jgi:uncharacterized protein (TIGR01777 family)
MKILVSGSHGLVGTALINSLTPDGHEIVRLVRNNPLEATSLEGLDAVVHLAGESIASSRWSDEKKRAIRESRTKGTALLSDALARLSRPPAVLVSASAIGYYGSRGDELLIENSAPGDDFLANVCVEWENATRPALEKGIRTVHARFGVILDKHGGALAKMLTPFRMGVGGRIGNGKQWMSWIAIDDVVSGLKFVISDQTTSGPVNFVAPNPVTNAEFTKTLGRVLSKPTLFPMPEFGVRLAFGEMGEALLLGSQRVKPAVLQQSGFSFAYPSLESALRHLLTADKRG